MRELIDTLEWMYWLTLATAILGSIVIVPLIATRLKWPSGRPSFWRLLGLSAGVVVLTIGITLMLTAAAPAIFVSLGMSEKLAIIVAAVLFFALPIGLPLLAFALSRLTGCLPTRRLIILALAVSVGIISVQVLVLDGWYRTRVLHVRAVDGANLGGIGKGLVLYHEEHGEYPSDLRRLVDEQLAGASGLLPFHCPWDGDIPGDPSTPYDGPCGWTYAHLDDDAPPETLWVWQTPNSHKGKGAYVLRYNGQVEWRTPDELADALQNSQPYFDGPIVAPSIRSAPERPAPSP